MGGDAWWHRPQGGGKGLFLSSPSAPPHSPKLLSSYRTHIFSDSLCAPNARIGLITQKMLNKCVLNLQNTWAKKDTEDGEFQRMMDRWDLNTFALGTLGNELG